MSFRERSDCGEPINADYGLCDNCSLADEIIKKLKAENSELKAEILRLTTGRSADNGNCQG